ncbi:MAG TPA: hypothetical protein VGL65_05100 [Gemmatimonadales bacterium]|jgi:hypothetical protein
MLRQITGLVVGALLIAPVGFGLSSDPLATVARAIFALCVVAIVVESFAALVWARRWPV